VVPAACAAIAVGVAGTAWGLAGSHDKTWWMLLVNFLFWTGLAQGMVVWSAIFRAAQATWTPAVNRLCHAAVHFLPVSLVFFILLSLGREHWLTWLHHPVPEKAAWLNPTFFFRRNGLGLALMTALSYRYLYLYRRGEQARTDEEVRDAQYRINRLAVTLVLLYCVVYSVLAFDLVMSLSPHWTSSLFGAYFFVTNLYLALAAVIIMASILRRTLALMELLGPRQLTDLGNLMLGFSLLSTGFFFAQYLTIWYGNLPEETSYLIVRTTGAWSPIAWMVLGCCYLGPFLLLCLPVVKTSPTRLVPVAVLALFGLAVERWVLVVPSLSPGRLAGLGAPQWCIPLGCVGVLLLAVNRSLSRQPSVSSLDVKLELSEGVSL
jgi:hypothetical protein